jgi:uncharacterized protein (TIGR02594 family)
MLSTQEPRWLKIARTFDGVKEGKGELNNPQVIEFFKSSASPVKQDSVAWCSAFLNHVMKQAGFIPTQSLAARSWMTWGTETTPRRGAVLVFKRGRASWQGHVTLYVGESATHYHCLGGNQGDKVCVASYAKVDLIACRWPPVMSRSRTAMVALAGNVSAGGTTGGVYLMQQAEDAKSVLSEISAYVPAAVYGMLGLTVACFLLTAWFRYTDMRDKGR